MAHILVIDDEREICRLIEKTLGRDGHTVTAKNSAVGLDAADLKQYDLLILDVMMPGIDGFSFCYQIRGAVDCYFVSDCEGDGTGYRGGLCDGC